MKWTLRALVIFTGMLAIIEANSCASDNDCDNMRLLDPSVGKKCCLWSCSDYCKLLLLLNSLLFFYYKWWRNACAGTSTSATVTVTAMRGACSASKMWRTTAAGTSVARTAPGQTLVWRHSSPLILTLCFSFRFWIVWALLVIVLPCVGCIVCTIVIALVVHHLLKKSLKIEDCLDELSWVVNAACVSEGSNGAIHSEGQPVVMAQPMAYPPPQGYNPPMYQPPPSQPYPTPYPPAEAPKWGPFRACSQSFDCSLWTSFILCVVRFCELL